jgi:Na+-driven multidrug efflux pump
MGDRALRMFTLAFPVIGFCMMSGMLFQSIGKPWHAFFLSLARQLVFFIPFLLVCPRVLPVLFGSLSPLDSVYLSAPMSDVLTFLVSVAFVRREARIFRRLEAETAMASAAAAGTVP